MVRCVRAARIGRVLRKLRTRPLRAVLLRERALRRPPPWFGTSLRLCRTTAEAASAPSSVACRCTSWVELPPDCRGGNGGHRVAPACPWPPNDS